MSKYKVKWVVTDKHLIKFNDMDDSCNIEESVDLSGISLGSEVEADIKDGIVIKMSLAPDKKQEVKKEEVKKEVKKEIVKEEMPVERIEDNVEEKVTQTWTIQGMTKKHDVVKFVEQPQASYWFPIEATIQKEFSQLKKGDKVTVEIGKVQAISQKGDAYMKDGVVAVLVNKVEKAKEIVEEKESAPVAEKTQVRQSSYRNEDETTRRTILMCAKDIVQSLIVSDKISKEEVSEVLLCVTEGVKNAMSNI